MTSSHLDLTRIKKVRIISGLYAGLILEIYLYGILQPGSGYETRYHYS